MSRSGVPTQPGDRASIACVLELAATLARQPAARDIQEALSDTVRRLLDDARDDLIQSALLLAPHGAAARLVRSTAEAHSERVPLSSAPARGELRLFTVPIVVAFTQEVPESQFENAIQPLGRARDLLGMLRVRCLQPTPTALLPQLFRPDHLSRLAFSPLRALALGLTSSTASALPPLSYTGETTYKRSTAFLRYIVGHRILIDGHPTDTPRVSPGLQEIVRHCVQEQLHTACDVTALYDGSFYSALYDGMWLYQDRRLDHLILHALSQARHTDRLSARIAPASTLPSSPVKLSFVRNQRRLGGHTFLISTRPGDSYRASARRIQTRLTAAGIPTDDVPTARPSGLRRMRPPTRAVPTTLEFAIPI